MSYRIPRRISRKFPDKKYSNIRCKKRNERNWCEQKKTSAYVLFDIDIARKCGAEFLRKYIPKREESAFHVSSYRRAFLLVSPRESRISRRLITATLRLSTFVTKKEKRGAGQRGGRKERKNGRRKMRLGQSERSAYSWHSDRNSSYRKKNVQARDCAEARSASDKETKCRAARGILYFTR